MAWYAQKKKLWQTYKVVNGKRVFFYGKTKKEAEQKKKEYERLLKKQISFDWKKASLNVLIDKFLEEHKDDWERSTYNWYQNMLNHLKRDMGDSTLWSVSEEDINIFLKSVAKTNPNTGRPASQKTLSSIASVVRQLFKWAENKKYIEVNPAISIKTPKQKRNNTKRTAGTRVLTLQEIGWIINTPHELQTANMILLYTGMRPEELLALRWSDIDINKKIININKALKYNKNTPYIGTTKTNENRIVIMPDDLVEYLTNITNGLNDGLVVPNAKGTYYSKSSWRRKYQSYITDLDILYGGKFNSKFNPHYKQTIQGWTPYALRHTSSTYGAVFGVNKKQLADNQGHDEQTMSKYYEQELLEYRRNEINKISFKKLIQDN